MSAATSMTMHKPVLKHTDSGGGHQESYGWRGDTLLPTPFTNTP